MYTFNYQDNQCIHMTGIWITLEKNGKQRTNLFHEYTEEDYSHLNAFLKIGFEITHLEIDN